MLRKIRARLRVAIFEEHRLTTITSDEEDPALIVRLDEARIVGSVLRFVAPDPDLWHVHRETLHLVRGGLAQRLTIVMLSVETSATFFVPAATIASTTTEAVPSAPAVMPLSAFTDGP
jgi:hypothetical protein